MSGRVGGDPSLQADHEEQHHPRKCLSVYRTFTGTAWHQMLRGPPLDPPGGPWKWVSWPHLQRDAPRSWPCPLQPLLSRLQSSSARVHPQGVPSHTCTVNMLGVPSSFPSTVPGCLLEIESQRAPSCCG